MYQIFYTNRMKKDLKRAKKRGKDISKLIEILNLLKTGKTIPQKFCDHQLSGNLKEFRECHIEPDWLLIYQIKKDKLILVAVATGTHSDLLDF